ncbi:hypothetical protein ABZ464_36195 [Streptomyces sp. NPDC005820]|uniref:hypothetical protein n=1 Tax=Streptomyces sp. NPDC005820 TaxID=3157069 RepID=UPI0033CD4C40
MIEGIVWLADLDGGASGIVFARGISPEELAVRMGAAPDGPVETGTEDEVFGLLVAWYRPGGHRDGLVRVGESAGWAFAAEYGDSRGAARLAEMSRGGVEAVRYEPDGDDAPEPPAVHYARDGEVLCGYGLSAEHRRWGPRRNLLVPELVAAGILGPGGRTYLPPEDGRPRTAYRRSLGVLERRFGLSLPPHCLRDARLPAHLLRTPVSG